MLSAADKQGGIQAHCLLIWMSFDSKLNSRYCRKEMTRIVCAYSKDILFLSHHINASRFHKSFKRSEHSKTKLPANNGSFFFPLASKIVSHNHPWQEDVCEIKKYLTSVAHSSVAMITMKKNPNSPALTKTFCLHVWTGGRRKCLRVSNTFATVCHQNVSLSSRFSMNMINKKGG